MVGWLSYRLNDKLIDDLSINRFVDYLIDGMFDLFIDWLID